MAAAVSAGTFLAAMSSSGTVTSGDGQTPAAELVLELRVLPGEPMRGELVGPDGRSSTVFCGWADLMSAITAERTATPSP